MKNDFNPIRAIYTPAETVGYGLRTIHAIKANKRRALSIGIPGIQDYFAPLLPGQLAAVIAQTSNYKSGFLHCIERHAARQIQRDGRQEVLIHVSVEEVVEEQAFLLLARESGEDAGRLARGDVQDWNRLEQAAIKVGQVPIYRIGESLARAEDLPHLTITNMLQAVDALCSGQVDGHARIIGGMFFDYLQAFPLDSEVRQAELDKQRRLQVRQDIYRLRQAAVQFNCPVWVVVQAKQVLGGAPSKNMYIPGIYDGEETSSIAQRADRIIQTWMPKMSFPVGSWVDYKDVGYEVSENLLWIKVGKQRGGLPSGRSWKCHINFQRNDIVPEASGLFAPEEITQNGQGMAFVT